MGCNPEIIEIAKEVKPDWVCLVPEKREEKTTEGGLDLLSEENFSRINKACVDLKNNNPKLKISLFLESNLDILKQVPKFDAPIDAVEIHTGDYAKAFLQGKEVASYLKEFEQAERFLAHNKIGCHAGHGLTMDSMGPLLEMELFSEFNIGHWIISEAIFQGLGPVIRHLKKLIQIKETPRISDKSFI
jgi:pyridoxine 5-phosphate synthase